MKKAESLAKWLGESVLALDLDNNPDRLAVGIEQGAVVATGAPGLSFQYRYRATVILLDYPGHPDGVVGPLLIWVARHQPDLLASPEKRKTGVTFEADIQADDKADLLIELELTETVRAVARPDGGYDYVHLDEPVFDVWEQDLDPVSPLHRFFVDGELVAACPHPDPVP